MSNPVLTWDTLKDLEELLGKATAGEWEDLVMDSDNPFQDLFLHTTGCSGEPELSKDDLKLIFNLRNNAPELLRLARMGMRAENEFFNNAKKALDDLDKDRKP